MSQENSNVQAEEVKTETPKVEAAKVEVQSVDSNENLMAALGYVLFFIPLIVEPKTEYKKFHANQGLLLLIYAVGVQILGYILPGFLGFIIVPLLAFSSFVFFVIGVINAFNGKKERLPILGQWDLLK